MSFLNVPDVPMAEVLPGLRTRRVIDQPSGAGAVTLGELEIDPGGRLPLHRHLVEEVVVALEGAGQLVVDGERHELARGSVGFAPAGSAHSLENVGDSVLRILFVYPAVNVQRYWVTGSR